MHKRKFLLHAHLHIFLKLTDLSRKLCHKKLLFQLTFYVFQFPFDDRIERENNPFFLSSEFSKNKNKNIFLLKSNISNLLLFYNSKGKTVKANLKLLLRAYDNIKTTRTILITQHKRNSRVLITIEKIINFSYT